MSRGRKPTPTALKLVRGNPGKRALPQNEPKPTPGAGECPDWLDADAKTEWFSKVAELEHMGILTRADDTALASYCREWSKYVYAEKQLMEHGQTVDSPNGYPMPSPWVNISAKAFEHVNKLRTEFGLTPVARVRLGTSKGNVAADPYDEWDKATSTR